MQNDVMIWWPEIGTTGIFFTSIKLELRFKYRSLQWRHNGRDGVSNHRCLYWLLSRLFKCGSKKTPKLRVSCLCGGIHRWLVNSPHKGPVTRKMFPFDDVIMSGTSTWYTYLPCINIWRYWHIEVETKCPTLSRRQYHYNDVIMSPMASQITGVCWAHRRCLTIHGLWTETVYARQLESA